jgi:hypothetical protein
MNSNFLRRGIPAAIALTLLAGGLSVAAQPAGAQASRVGADPVAIPELRAEFERAAKLGLATEPLIAKARQGFVAAASTGRIRDAVRGLTDRLVKARTALQPVRSDAELEAGASALQSGIPDGVLRDLRKVDRNRSLAVPIGVLEELVVRGVPLKQAATNVQAMLRRNVGDVIIASVGRNVQGDVASGLAPSVAMDVRSRGVLSLPQAAAAGAAVAPTRIPPP